MRADNGASSLRTLNPATLRPLIRLALKEDVGSGDVTTQALFQKSVEATGAIRVKQPTVLAGLPVARAVFQEVNPRMLFKAFAKDGQAVKAGTVIARVSGDGRSILKGERVALNFLQRLCGIATFTQQYVEKVRNTRARILDTRKTTPGLRTLEKYAVRMGGGVNHRMSLSHGILIKDNHIALAGGVFLAVQQALRRTTGRFKIEVEVSTLQEAEEALAARADIILLDNMELSRLRKVVKLIRGRARTEVSGGVHLNNIRKIAGLGVDFISIGALTHSAPAADIHLTLVKQSGIQ